MRHLTGNNAVIGNLWLAGAAVLHFYYAGWGYPEPLKLATLHLTLFLPAIFILFPAKRVGFSEDIEEDSAPPPSILDWVLAAISIVPPLYAYLNPERVYDRAVFISPLTTFEVIFACVMVVLVLEGVRRALSMALSILAGLTILYMFFADLLPGIWNYRDMPLSQIAETMYMMNGSGLFGLLTGISATIVATFLIFGAFLQQSGLGNLFMNFGNLVAGRLSGGPAKVAVITSALFGSTSGSSVANVVVTGSISIPMMKKLGFRGSMAAGIEAAASVGGLIMPPVMGAAAFVMAELIQVPYWDIVKAAFLGGALYFFGILITVHFISKRMGIAPLPKEEMPRWKDLIPDIHLVLPLILLVTMMAMRFSAYQAAFYSTIAIVVVSWLRPHTRMYPLAIFQSLVRAGSTIAVIAVAVTCAGIIMAALTNTGLILAFGGIVTSIAGESVMVLVLLLAGLCLLLGMGVPTTPAYIITSAIGTPILAGVTDASLLQIHLFVFYFAVLADATPPVAAASFAAASIAKANPLVSGAQAFRMAIGGFIAGFSFLFAPGLTFEAPWLEIILTFTGLCASIALFSIGTIGYVTGPLNIPLRIVMAVGGLFCALGHEVLAMETRAFIAFGLLAIAFLWDWYLSAKPQPRSEHADMKEMAMSNYDNDRSGQKVFFGADLGILMVRTYFTRYPGDIGNATTWDFPVNYKVVHDAVPSKMTDLHNASLLEPFKKAARELVDEGMDAITTTCGFLSIYQQELVDDCGVPVATSALLQVPLVQTVIGSKKRVGVMTYNGDVLDGPYFEAVNVPLDTPVKGMPQDGEFVRWIKEGDASVPFETLRQEVLAAAREFHEDHPDLGAIVCECTNLAPFSADIAEELGLPVYDCVTLVNWFQAGLKPKRYNP